MEQPIRVLVVVGHESLRANLICFLSAQASLEVIGEAATGAAALDVVLAQPPDVIVLDMRLPGAAWPDLIRQINRVATPTQVILLTPEGEPEYERLATRWNVAACVPWDQADQELLGCIRKQGTRKHQISLVPACLTDTEDSGESGESASMPDDESSG